MTCIINRHVHKPVTSLHFCPRPFDKVPSARGEGLGRGSWARAGLFSRQVPGNWDLPQPTRSSILTRIIRRRGRQVAACLRSVAWGKQTCNHSLSALQSRSQALGGERGGVRTRPAPSSRRGNRIRFKSAGEETLKMDQADRLLTGSDLNAAKYC